MSLEDVPDSDAIKHAWTIVYGDSTSGSSGNSGSGSNPPQTPTSKQGGGGGGGDGELSSPGGSNHHIRHSRTESADGSADLAMNPAASPMLNSPSGGGAADGRKAMLLYAKTAEEKVQWMTDINALIEANNKKQTSRIAGLARQGTLAQLS